MRSSCCRHSSRTAWRWPPRSVGPATFRRSTCPPRCGSLRLSPACWRGRCGVRLERGCVSALLDRFGLLRAGTAMGVIVALWHLPLFMVSNQPQSTFSFLPFLLTLMVARILIGWVYVGTGGSVLLCVLFHASGNAWSEVLPVPRPDFTAAWMAETAVLTVAAAAVVIQSRIVG